MSAPNADPGPGPVRRRMRAFFRGRLRLGFARAFERERNRQLALAAAVIAALALVMLPELAPRPVDVQVGQVSPYDIQAPRTVENRYRTQALQEEAVRNALRAAAEDPANYEINPAVAIRAEQMAERTFAVLAEVRRQAAGAQAPAGTPQASSEAPGAAAPGAAPGTGRPAGAGQSVTPTAAEPAAGEPLAGPDGGQPAQEQASQPFAGAASGEGASDLESGAGRRITGTPAVDQAALAGAVDLAALRLEREVGIRLSREHLTLALTASPPAFDAASLATARLIAQVMNAVPIGEGQLEEGRAEVERRAYAMDVSSQLRDVAAAVAAQLVQPNLTLSRTRIERIRQEAIAAVQPVTVQQDQIILRRGDVVTEEHIQLLTDLGMLRAGGRMWTTGLGVLLLLVGVTGGTGAYLHRFHPDTAKSSRLVALIGMLVVLVAALAKGLSLIPWPGAGFLTPVGLAGMLVGLLLDARLAMVVSFGTAAVAGFLFGPENQMMLVGLATGVAGSYSVSRVGQRSDLTRAGLFVGAVGFGAMLAIGLVRNDIFIVLNSWVGLVNGLVCGVATIGLLPYLEALFGITSSVRLLELSNPNQPLLRRLLLEAPGTYHHSIMVGNLAEAAAEAVGGDALLCRVGAQYHDVGKLKRPYFFVENQFANDNPHDKIAPSLSTLIIISHVKDGMELAREYKLPSVIVDFIRMHHGTDLVRYFYSKAQADGQALAVDEKDFRYPGPKPQSKETAIVMLADSTEAAVRSLSRPTPGRIEGLVRKVIKERLADGQLDECNLTLKDLDSIANAFVRVLTGMFHARIEYPEVKSLREVERRRA